jgi:hypothetical protein
LLEEIRRCCLNICYEYGLPFVIRSGAHPKEIFVFFKNPLVVFRITTRDESAEKPCRMLFKKDSLVRKSTLVSQSAPSIYGDWWHERELLCKKNFSLGNFVEQM